MKTGARSFGNGPRDGGLSSALMQAFRDAGMEVIYTGRYQSPEGVAQAAVAEDVDIVALSDHCGSMPIIARAVKAALADQKAEDIKMIAGGLISPQDKDILEAMGVTGNYSAGTPVQTAVDHVKALMQKAPSKV